MTLPPRRLSVQNVPVGAGTTRTCRLQSHHGPVRAGVWCHFLHGFLGRSCGCCHSHRRHFVLSRHLVLVRCQMTDCRAFAIDDIFGHYGTVLWRRYRDDALSFRPPYNSGWNIVTVYYDETNRWSLPAPCVLLHGYGTGIHG